MIKSKALVLGSNSFLGLHNVNYLAQDGYEVMGISRSNINAITYNFRFVQKDINTDFDSVANVIDEFRPNIIVNYIAQCMVAPSWDYPSDYFETNTVALVKLVKHLLNKDYLNKFVQISTPEVYGNISNSFRESRNYNPTTPYGASKAAFDMYLHMVNYRFKFPVVMARTANIYGPYQQLYRIIPKTIIKIKKGEKLTLDGGGTSKRYFLHVSDLMVGIQKLITDGDNGHIYHFSSLNYLSIKNLVVKICELMNYDFDSLVTVGPDRLGKDDEYAINCDKSHSELHWRPTIGINDGLLSVINWIDKDWDIIKDKSLEYVYKS
jgi:dTDP-glucose 4,6-dehydratase